MKSILISIKSKYVADILNGKKTIEIRKSMPKCDLPIDVYIYCTNGKPLIRKGNKEWFVKNKNYEYDMNYCYYAGFNGKVVAKFTLRKVDEFVNGCKMNKKTPDFNDYKKYNLLGRACLSEEELTDYANDLSFFAWHISNLVIFDKPKELSEFYKYQFIETTTLIDEERQFTPYLILTKAPQSMCYVEAIYEKEN